MEIADEQRSVEHLSPKECRRVLPVAGKLINAVYLRSPPKEVLCARFSSPFSSFSRHFIWRPNAQAPCCQPTFIRVPGDRPNTSSSCRSQRLLQRQHDSVRPRVHPAGSAAQTWHSQLALPDGTSLPALLNSQGFGFAASSFSKDGLAIVEGIQDTKTLMHVIQDSRHPRARGILSPARRKVASSPRSPWKVTPPTAAELPYAALLAVSESRLHYFG